MVAGRGGPMLWGVDATDAPRNERSVTMSPRKLLVASGLVAFLAVGCAVDATSQASPEGAVGTGTAEQALGQDNIGTVGDGFNARTGDFSTIRCVKGGGIERVPGRLEKVIRFDKVESLASANQLLQVDVDASAKFGTSGVDAKASFARNVASTSRSIGYVYTLGYDSGAERFMGDTIELSDQARKLLDEPEKFMAACGDHFVRANNLGSRLYVSLRIDFASDDAKQSFEASVGGNASWLKVSSGIKTLSESARKNLSVHLDVYAEGGGNGMSRILGSQDLAHCSVDDLESCNKLMTDAVAYTQTSEFVEATTREPAVVGHDLRGYDALGGGNLGIDELPTAVVKARTSLAEAYTERQALESWAYGIDGMDAAKLRAVRDLIRADLTALEGAAAPCTSGIKTASSADDPRMRACVDAASHVTLHGMDDLRAAVRDAIRPVFIRRVVSSPMCLDNYFGRLAEGNPVGSHACNRGSTQVWTLTDDHKLHAGGGASPWCVTSGADGVVLTRCDGPNVDAWHLDERKQLANTKNQCIPLGYQTNEGFHQSRPAACGSDEAMRVVFE